MSTAKNTLYCSFCCKSQHEVACLIAGPSAFICDECVDFCVPIAAESRLRRAGPLDVGAPSPVPVFPC